MKLCIIQKGEKDFKTTKQDDPSANVGALAKTASKWSLPSENDIRSYINKLQTTKKKGGGVNVPKQPDESTRLLKQSTHRNPKMKPAQTYLIVKNSFPTASNVSLPCDAQIKKKFSICKSQMKKV